MNATEVWEAPYLMVVDELRRKGSEARERGQLAGIEGHRVGEGDHLERPILDFGNAQRRPDIAARPVDRSWTNER